MWIINKDTEKWTSNIDKLEVTDYQSFKRDLKFLRFYQRVLSASTFVRMDDFNNIYDVLSHYKSKTYNYSTSLSQYVSPYMGSIKNSYPITSSASLHEFKNKFLPEYGLTLKNLFTPKRLIDDQIKNLFYVDLATTDIISDFSSKKPGLSIDSVLVKEGHRVLVKNQYSIVTLDSSIDPYSYFDGYFQIKESIGSNITYIFYTSENGIYKYKNEKLVRESDIDLYEDIIKYSICVKLGVVNRETQWSLQRLNNGFFPEYLNNESIYFKEKHNYVLRNRMDYNNLYENVLYDTLKHATQSLTIDNITYTIPERTISIGEFGVILNNQEGYTNIINSKYKVNLRSISETDKNYWVCGDDGTLLKINKIDFEIEKIKLFEDLAEPKYGDRDSRIYRDEGTVLTTLNCVSFYNELRGVVVGKFNQIWITDNGGYNWKRINIVDFDGFNFNTVIYKFINKFYLGGDNGVFMEFIYEDGNWTAFKRRVSRFEIEEEYLLVDDITDLKYFNSSSNLYSGTSSFIAISAKNDNLYLYDITNSISSYSFIYLGTPTFSDINSIEYSYSSNKLYLSTFESIYNLDPLSGTISLETNILNVTYSSFYTQSGINSIYSYNNDLIFAGNNSLWENGSSTFSTIYENTFFERLKPRLLFMDYDAGSKLYWFDDYGQYRIPSRYELPVTYLIDPMASNETQISFRQNSNSTYDSVNSITHSYFDNNWITYWKDRLKTFEYYTHLSDTFKVEPSFAFKSSDYLSGVFTYSSVDITCEYSDIQNLMPSVTSKFREQTATISYPANFYSLYFYDFLGVWAVTIGSTQSAPEKGDVIYIDCNLFKGNFIINKIVSEISGSDIIYYQYFYTDFNDNIVNNLKYDKLTGYLEIRNLNRYPTKKGGVKSFSILSSGTNYNQGSYVSVESSSNTGCLATFDIEIDGSFNVSSIILNESGSGFSVGDTILISDSSVIGGSGDITLSVDELDLSSLFIDNFKKHYISNGYDIDTSVSYYPNPISSPIGITQSFQITGKYSQFSAYYNLQANIEVLNTDGYLVEDDVLYTSGFLNFGYTPTYNLLSYLNFIDNSKYVPSKEFLALPKYDDIPGPDSGIPDTYLVNDNIVYVDFILGSYSNKLETNKVYFGVNLKHIWDSFMLWTFVDLTIKEGSSWPPDSNYQQYLTNRLIIIDKYYDDSGSEPYYVMVFHDKFSGTNTVSSISIHSRRTLQNISDDLQYLNGLQRPYEDADNLKWSSVSIESGYTYTNYENNIKFKIPTDSYTKALLSDSDIVMDLSGIVYTDYKYELAVQITKLQNEFEFIPTVVRSVNSKYQFSFTKPHGLIDGESVSISIVGTYSNYPSLLGYHVIKYLDDTAIEINIPWTGFSQDKLVVRFTKKDSFLNFEPIDIFDLGVGDKKVKQSIQILSDNYDLSGNKYFLKNIDFKKYRFRLIDGLDLVRLTEDFFWILDAEVSNAIIGLDDKQNIVWYKGTWEGGRWFDGTWISGTWKSGDWYGGRWSSKIISDNLLSVKVDNSITNNFSSIWYGGRWFGGTWENGTWYSGRWYDGVWENGRWFDGTWNDGTWNNGVFSGGIWVLGTWNNGIFNTDSSLSYWLDGKFLGGDFENGIWYNGEFNQKSVKTRFGTKSFNSRNSVWYGGKFIKGEFHSLLNLNDQNLPIASESNKYSKWYSGLFMGGNFYGGDVYNINFNSALWISGILNDIDIIQIKSNSYYNEFKLDGIYRLNVGDSFYIVDNFTSGTFSVFGTTENPKKYKVLDATINEDDNTTDVVVDIVLSDILSVNTGILDTELKFVSSFKDSTWNNGIWNNGVFDGGYFNGGIWYNGNFSGIWG